MRVTIKRDSDINCGKPGCEASAEWRVSTPVQLLPGGGHFSGSVYACVAEAIDDQYSIVERLGRGAAGDRCGVGNNCGRAGCPECQP